MDTVLKLFALEDGFDLFFIVFMGIWQFGFFLGGGLFLLIGLVVLYDFFSWRTSPNKYVTTGEVIGVRVSGSKLGLSEQQEEKEDVLVREAVEQAKKGKKSGPLITFFGGAVGLIFAILVLAIPFSFFGFGAYSAYDFYDTKNTGIQTQGHVVDYNSVRGSEGGITLHAVLSFQDKNNREWQFQDRYGSGKRKFNIGQKLPVIYKADKPDKAFIDDYWHNMLLPAIFMGIGGVIVFFIFGGGNMLVDRFNKEKHHTSEPQKSRFKSYAGEMYYEVIEYVTDRGERVRAGTNSGTSSLSKMVPGMRIQIIADKDKPNEVRRRSLFWFWLALIVFIAPSSLFLFLAFKDGISPLFFLIVAYFGITKGGKLFKIWREYKALSPEEKQLKKDGFIIRKQNRDEQKSKMPMLDKYDVQDRLRYYMRQARQSALMLFIIGVGAVYGGYAMAPEFLEEFYNNPKGLLDIKWSKLKEEEMVSVIGVVIGSLMLLLCVQSYNMINKMKRF